MNADTNTFSLRSLVLLPVIGRAVGRLNTRLLKLFKLCMHKSKCSYGSWQLEIGLVARMHRYPKETVATAQDFRQSGWRAAIKTRNREGYSGMWTSLSQAAIRAIETNKVSEGKVLWLLADACSMMLRPDSPNAPFGPILRTNERRSALPDDFEDADLGLFTEILEGVDDVWLRARLADLLWLLRMPRDPKNALTAIDSYREVALDSETWIRGGKECWQRAIVLARMLRGGAGDRLDQMQASILIAFDSAENEGGYLPLWVARLLAENHLARDKALHIATKLNAMARQFGAEGDLRCARDYYEAASTWFEIADDTPKAVEATVAVGETWITEAEATLSSEQPSYSLAASHYESAIQVYRRIPGPHRDAHGVAERIADLHRRMKKAAERAPEELGVIRSSPIDLRETIGRARDSVQGKSGIDALKAFAELASVVTFKKERKLAEKTLRKHPLLAIFPATHIARDGRVIAKSPGGVGEFGSEEYELNIWSLMMRGYSIHVSLEVQGSIWPALEVLNLEHRFSEADFVSIALRSPIVPRDHEQLFGKALFAGLEREFAVALHLLVPQIEHMVRCHLKASGARTTTLNQAGVEYEVGLSSLMKLSAAERIFGEDLTFELKALFCDSRGPNLRNQVAHGLVDDSLSQATPSVYAWWFGLRLAFITFWNSFRVTGQSEGGQQDEA